VENRGDFQEKLTKKGVPTAVHYPKPIYKQMAYASIANQNNHPVTDRAAERVISLPMYPDMTVEIQKQIIAAVIECIA